MSDFAYPLHEECGVFGLYDRAGTEDVAAAAYSALYALQHRGQESCGIAVNDDGVIQGHRDLGLVNEVFTPAVLGSLANPNAHMATGHVRYATSGSRIRANAQPMIVRHGRGTMALCHNGNLTNAIELRRQLENEGAIFHGSSDTEVICYLITRNRLDVLEGAYSLVIMSATKLIAVRDPRGYRPLCIGTLPGGGYVFASESCALDAVGATLLRDVEPGEIVVADAKTGELRSITDHVGYSQESGIPYGIGFIKNKYIGRTFIQGSQKQRENSVRIKLNVISNTVKGKRVVLVDDSIVRGTTSARIIKLLRDAGATEVHFMVSAPPFKYPCYFGTDIPDQKLLVATGRTVDQINEIIGADTLGYLSTEHVVQLAKNANCGFCTACFTGEYAVKPDEVLSTDIHERHLNDRPKDEKKLGE